MRKGQFGASLIIATLLAGCSANRGLEDVPVINKPPRRAVVGLGSVINNIKCDILDFMKDNDLLTERGQTLGGTLVFTIDRSNVGVAGIKLGIPVATGVKVNGGLDLSQTHSFGESVSTPFVITFKKDEKNIDCSQIMGHVTYSVPGQEDVDQTLSAPLLDIADLKPALHEIIKGNPTVTFADFSFKGSVILAKEQNNSVGIDVLFISPSLSEKITSDYKIEYNIGTNWQKILGDAGYNVEGRVTPPRLAAPSKVSSPTKGKNLTGAAQKPKVKVNADNIDGPIEPMSQRVDVSVDPVTGAVSVHNPRRE